MSRRPQAPLDPTVWLRDELAGRSPRMQRRLLAKAARAGLSACDLRAAAAALGVEIIGEGTRLAFWRLAR